MSEWQPIDTAPRDGTPILISDGQSCVHLAWFKGDDEAYPWFLVDNFDFHVDGNGNDCVELNSAMDAWGTYWMPLPTAPTTFARVGKDQVQAK